MFLQASDIFRPRNSVPNSLHRASIAPGPKRRTLARNVHSLCMHPPVTPKYTTQTIRRRWPALFPNLFDSRRYLSQTRLAGQLPIHAKLEPSPDSAQTHALRRVRLPRQPGVQQRQPHREADAPADLWFVPLPGWTDVDMYPHNGAPPRKSATPDRDIGATTGLCRRIT